ncbi:hypothetical protein [Flavobacterium sp.]|uniref:DUF6712 family protein n=1 Tax=Flavobacterium sp. TaxID=239 RepID=UPI0025C46567|nr:hypothetical protein [Flavobacterium sp.]MBA4154149.1 hypothetical protein [Flavobacterium sp.]
MILLITKAQAMAFLQIAVGVSDTEYEKFIEQAQDFDLKELVCEEFYHDLLKNKTQENYAKLITGGEYEYNENTYSFKGLAGVLAFFSYARFQLESPAVSTSFGMQFKTTPNSQPVPLEERRNTYYQKKSQANKLMEDVVKYIERNIELFPKYNCQNKCGSSSTGGFSTKVIQ